MTASCACSDTQRSVPPQLATPPAAPLCHSKTNLVRAAAQGTLEHAIEPADVRTSVTNGRFEAVLYSKHAWTTLLADDDSPPSRYERRVVLLAGALSTRPAAHTRLLARATAPSFHHTHAAMLARVRRCRATHTTGRSSAKAFFA